MTSIVGAAIDSKGRPRPLRRDTIAVGVSLAIVVAAAWIYVVVQAQQMSMSGAGQGAMSASSGMATSPSSAAWTPAVLASQFAVWMAMMVAMMLPTALPMTLIYAAVARKAAQQQHPLAPTSVFVLGYVALWVVFSIAATIAQVALQQGSHLSSLMALRSAPAAGALLIAAGVYQLTPLKRACLRNCRSPVHFLARRWRRGPVGAAVMGMSVGAYCVGCCWVLMALLFVGGAMNLAWAAAIAVFVLLEKVAPFGNAIGLLAAPGLVAAGIVLLVL